MNRTRFLWAVPLLVALMLPVGEQTGHANPSWTLETNSDGITYLHASSNTGADLELTLTQASTDGYPLWHSITSDGTSTGYQDDYQPCLFNQFYEVNGYGDTFVGLGSSFDLYLELQVGSSFVQLTDDTTADVSVSSLHSVSAMVDWYAGTGNLSSAVTADATVPSSIMLLLTGILVVLGVESQKLIQFMASKRSRAGLSGLPPGN